MYVEGKILYVQMARVKMTARRVDEDDAGASIQAASTPVTRSASRRTASKEETPLIQSKERRTVDSHLLFGASPLTKRDFEKYKDRGYLEDPECCRAGGNDITPVPQSGEIVLFEDFLLQGLRLPINDFVAEVLESFEVFFHQVTPDTFVWMSVYAWALASQGLKPNPEAFCRSFVLRLTSKKDKTTRKHPNFGCYTFEVGRRSVSPAAICKSSRDPNWTQRWFYYKVDADFRREHKSLLMVPLRVSFGVEMIMPLSSPSVKPALTAYACVCSQICMRDIVEEFVAYAVDPLRKEIDMPAVLKKQSPSKLIRLPYVFDPVIQGFKSPNAAWKKVVIKTTNSLVGEYTAKESEQIFASFPERSKKKLNRVFDAFKVSYADHENLHEKRSPPKAGTSRASERIAKLKEAAKDTPSPLCKEDLTSRLPKTPSIAKALKVLKEMKQKLPASKESISTAPLSFSSSDTESSDEPYIPALPRDERVFEAATPVSPGTFDEQPLGTQHKEKGDAGDTSEAHPEMPASEDINVDALGINWDQGLLRSISEATVPPFLEDKLKETSFDEIFDESKKNLTKVKILICFVYLALLLRIYFSDTKSLNVGNCNA